VRSGAWIARTVCKTRLRALLAHARERSTRVYNPEREVVPYPEEQSRALWSGQRFAPRTVKA